MNRKISLMSLICAVMVVIMHSSNAEDFSGVAQAVYNVVVGRFFKIAVPFFFLASGYFLGKHVNETNWWVGAVTKRFKTLVVPFVLWCWAFTVYLIGVAMVTSVVSGQDLFANVNLPWLTSILPGVDVFNDPSYWPLWYVRALLVIMLISVPIVGLVKKFGYCFPIVMFLLSLWTNGFVGIDTPIGYFFNKFCSVYGVFYFSLGLCFRLKPIQGDISKGGGALILFAGCLLSAFGAFPARFSSFFVTLSCPVIILGIWCVLPDCELPKWAGRLSFPLYVTHYFIIVALNLIFKRYDVHIAGLRIFVNVLLTVAFCVFCRKAFLVSLNLCSVDDNEDSLYNAL